MVVVVIKPLLTGLHQYSSLFVYQTQMCGTENFVMNFPDVFVAMMKYAVKL